jgi:hypothetical protein
MNKLLIFPMSFMFLLTIFSTVYTGVYYSGQSSDYSSQSGTEIQGETGTVEIPSGGIETYNIWESGTGYAMIILIGAITVGIIAGIKILGSGLSDPSQSMIFNGILFLGLWACLTVISSQFLFDSAIAIILWISLTMIYVIGLGMHINPSGGSA